MYIIFHLSMGLIRALKSYMLFFVLMLGVGLSAQTFTSGVPLSSPNSSGILNPYPNNITVSGIGDISSVSVTLIGVTHSFSGDLEVLLVGPTGASSILMSDVGVGNDFLNDNITFQTGGAPFAVASGTYAPIGSDFNGGAPAPSGPYSADLSVFDFTNADGIWSLYVNDDAVGDFGGISDWSLSFTSTILRDTTVIISCDNYITPWNDTIYQSSFQFDTIRDINGLDSFYNVYDITINNYLDPILSVSGPECSPNPSFNFTATSSNPNISTFRWYNQVVGGSLLNTGPNYVASFNATSSVFVSQGGQLAPFPAQTSLNTGANTGGYWFVAPNAFVITSLFVPTSDSSKFQNIAVIRMDDNLSPPTASLSTNDFSTLFITQVNPTRGSIAVNIPIQAGEVIGILGSRESDNSYSNANNQTIINGDTIPLKRIAFPGLLTTTSPYNVSSFPLASNISRVLFEYSSSNVCINPDRTEIEAIVNPVYLTEIDTIVCDSLVFANGMSYDFSQSIYDSLQSVNACDSIVKYNLVVNYSTFDTIVAAACDSFVSPSGTVYFNSTTFYDTTFYATGCTNVKYIDLTVNSSSVDTVAITQCDEFTTPLGITFTTDTFYGEMLQSVNSCDSLVYFDVTINVSEFTSQNIIACDEYSTGLNGPTYYTSGIYFDTLQTAQGCDSILETNLVVNYSTLDSIVETHCDVYTSSNGNIYTTSTIFYDTLITNSNCDSLVYVDLTINQSTFQSLSVTACDYYFSPAGDWYTTSSIFSDTLTTSNGCDSIINIDLTVNYNENVNNYITVCDTFVSPLGFGYNSSSIFTEVLTTSAGCDSSVTFFLTVNQSEINDVEVVACESYTSNSGDVFTSNAMYSDTLSTIFGCDSIVNFEVTILNPTLDQISIAVCDEFVSSSGTLYTTSQTIYDTLASQYGCDSIVQIDLNIGQSELETIYPEVCDVFTSSGGITYNTSGVYVESYNSVQGCDSIITIFLEVNPVILHINKEGNVLESLDFEASYQWLNCTSGEIVSGETSRVFEAPSNESYAVIVDNGSCIDTSDCVSVNSIGTSTFWIENIQLTFYPNPVRDLLIISASHSLDDIPYKLIDISGRIVKSGVLYGNVNELSLDNVSQDGVLFLQIQDKSIPILKMQK